MAKIYGSSATGQIVRFLQSAKEENRWPDVPPGADVTLDFDEAQAGALIAALNTAWNTFSISPAGKLLQNGQQVSLPQGNSQGRSDRLALPAILTKLQGNIPLTPQENTIVLRYLVEQVYQLNGGAFDGPQS